MNSKRFLYPGLLFAALIVAACGPKAMPEPTAVPTAPMPTDTPTLMSPTDTPVPAPIAEAPTPALSKTQGPATSEGEVPTGFTEDGAPCRGDPNAAVTLVEYSDFQ